MNTAVVQGSSGAAVDIVYSYTYTYSTYSTTGSSIGAMELHFVIGTYLGTALFRSNNGTIYRGSYLVVHIVDSNSCTYSGTDTYSQICIYSQIADIAYIVGCYLYILGSRRNLGILQCCLGGAIIVDNRYTGRGTNSCCTARNGIGPQIGLGLFSIICLYYSIICSSDICIFHYGLGSSGEIIYANSTYDSYACSSTNAHVGPLLNQGHIRAGGGFYSQLLGIDGGFISCTGPLNSRSGIAGEVVGIYSSTW